MLLVCRSIVVILALAATVAVAQQPPYDVFPVAEPPYYRVRYEASDQPGKLSFAVSYTVWIPAGVQTLRGVVVHQHGCGEGSCKSGLTGAYDLHWQALAKKHGCALLSPSYEQPQDADCQMWCDPRNGSAAAFERGLVELGKMCGHPELAAAPLALWGHSGGGHWCGGLVMMQPERVAAAWLRSGVPLLDAEPDRDKIRPHSVPDAALRVPMMCNLGTKEGVSVKGGRFANTWPANLAFFREVRGSGGLLGIAIDPLTAHECGNSRYLAIPWLDKCLELRLPIHHGEALRMISPDGAWLTEPIGTTATPASQFDGDRLTMGWLPDESIANAWMQFCKDTNVSDPSPPPAPTGVEVDGQQLRWHAEADSESGLSKFIVMRDGKPLADVTGRGKNPFGRQLFQNLQYSDTPTQPLEKMEFTDATAVGETHQYEIITVNTVGLQSTPTAAVRLSK
ncbi:alpha/beta hydrolase family protein [Allorhodopirellula heiligendammensis]|uniref:Esterase PHB depolymerase n=1 Tax=Allorhodopirellula heiligendammensis TaxID=2714739 RepID=A0A5C6BXY8_9BACT|nr:hypothetical protein [Allorhodopirellula heiligendammensis]TWU15499.1 hypothetical protein Poly21_26960 [Allorhodopirellula heiligendammensis]